MKFLANFRSGFQQLSDADWSGHTNKLLGVLLTMCVCMVSISTVFRVIPSVPVMTLLLALATALATLYESKSLPQRLMKLGIGAILVLVQWQAVSKEKQTQADANARSTAVMDAEFKSLIDRADKQLSVSTTIGADQQQQFGRTLGRLDASIKAERETILQTRPRSLITFSDVSVHTEIDQGDTISVTLLNQGTGPATHLDVFFMATAYPSVRGEFVVSKDDWRAAQKEFENSWTIFAKVDKM